MFLNQKMANFPMRQTKSWKSGQLWPCRKCGRKRRNQYLSGQVWREKDRLFARDSKIVAFTVANNFIKVYTFWGDKIWILNHKWLYLSKVRLSVWWGRRRHDWTDKVWVGSRAHPRKSKTTCGQNNSVSNWNVWSSFPVKISKFLL